MLNPGDAVWCEDPGYPAARTTLALAGVRVEPVPVDEDGVDVDAGIRRAPAARAAYVTPSHQFPTGSVMGLGRRLRLLDWAARHDAWILEDDYDSEFCYDRPLSALQGIDEHESVIYLGTLNKITYPGLRLGYLVVPESVVDAFASVADATSVGPPVATQAAFADFIAEGRLSQHITRMRELYQQRQELVLSEFAEHAGGGITIRPKPTGMHVLGTLNHYTAEHVAQRGLARGLDLRTLAGYALTQPQPDALVIGYTHLSPADIRSAARTLGRILS